MAAPRFDAAILGGGPAGATVGRLLAEWGHRVIILTRAPKHPLGESLPPSTRRLFTKLDLLATVDAARFLRSTGNTVWWAGTAARSEPFPLGEMGYQVERSTFDRLLLDAARAAGAVVVEGVAVRGVAPSQAPGLVDPREWPKGDFHDLRVALASGGGDPEPISAAWALDCSGRGGVLARRGLRRLGSSRTLALYAAWDRPLGWSLPNETHTLVESYPDGWAWSVPVSPTRRYVTVMVDPLTTGLTRGGDVTATYRAELEKTLNLRDLVRDARLHCGPGGVQATPYDACQFGGEGWLLLGDAASFIDPLSSFGVKKALASAWLAAVVVHTSLTTPALQPAALELFERREREAATGFARSTATHFAEAQGRYAHPFWAARAVDEATDPMGDPSTEPNVEALRRDPEVLGAFETLKQAPNIVLERGPDAAVRKRPTVRDRLVVLEDHLVAQWCPAGARFVRGVNLPRVIELAPGFSQVPDLFEAYNRTESPAALPDFLGALAVLLGKGGLAQRAAMPD